MKGFVLLSLASLSLALSCTSASAPTPAVTPTATPVPTLRTLAHERGIGIGAAVGPQFLRDEPLYAETLAREFTMLTLENAMKFGPVHPEPDRYDFTDADFIVDFAEAHDMRVRGHTLVWHNQLPAWLTERSWTREELIDILREHITTVVGHYRGRVAAWDVVNEAIADDGSLRDTIWLRGIGPEYVDLAFRWAHEADPDALLFYNDYAAEGLGPKSDAVYALVQGLLQRGVPIDGVGLQMHVSLRWPPDPEAVAANMARLGALGLQVHVTEMDVRIQDGVGTTEERLAAQAGIYRDMVEVCLESSACKAFVTWGFTDRHSWIPAFTGQPDAPLLFDESYRPKPAYYAIMDALAGR
jgi:endo-1,4-beta-xylanase